MAEEEKKEGEGGEAAAAPAAAPAKNKKTIIIIAVSAVLVLAIVGGVVAYIMGREKVLSPDAAKNAGKPTAGLIEEGTDEEEILAEGEESLGAIFPLETLVVNLTGGGFIRVQLQIEFNSRTVSKRFQIKLVPIRDAIIQLLSAKRRVDLLSREGKEDLKIELITIINEMLGRDEIKNIYFTTFVIQ